MSNESPANTPEASAPPLIEPGPASAGRTNPWKVSTFVVGGAGLALAVITGLAGIVIGSAVDRHGDLGPRGRDGGFAAGAPGWGDRGPGRHHHDDRRDRGDRGDGPGFDDREVPQTPSASPAPQQG